MILMMHIINNICERADDDVRHRQSANKWKDAYILADASAHHAS